MAAICHLYRVEVATNLPDIVAVRDSKNPTGLALTFTAATWNNLLADIRSGRI